MTAKAGYLLDTNVISETRKPRPHQGILSFMAKTPPSLLYVSVLTLGEVRKGIAVRRQRDPAGADAIALWVDGIEYGFADRVLPVDSAVTRIWGELSAQRSRPVIDTLIAASAIVHGLTMVTRNVADIDDIDLPVLNPFKP